MRTLVAILVVAIAVSVVAQPPGGNKNPPPPNKSKDLLKPGEKPKADAKPKPKPIKDPLIIKITTTTGQGNKYAGSATPRVYLLINGDDKQKHRLTNRNKPFQRGARDNFELKIDFDPAKIESVRLTNESDDMWKCETIQFQFFRRGKESRILKHEPMQYLSAAPERKKLHAKPFIDIKMKVGMDEPKKSAGEASG
jgi:hypothetical protein